jgi:hypothetical protein
MSGSQRGRLGAMSGTGRRPRRGDARPERSRGRSDAHYTAAMPESARCRGRALPTSERCRGRRIPGSQRCPIPRAGVEAMSQPAKPRDSGNSRPPASPASVELLGACFDGMFASCRQVTSTACRVLNLTLYPFMWRRPHQPGAEGRFLANCSLSRTLMAGPAVSNPAGPHPVAGT